MRGAFKHNPDRRREDAPGSGLFDQKPPDYLTGEEIAAWHELVAVLPLVALTGTDQFAVVQAARIWATLKKTSVTSSDFRKLDDSFKQWAIQLGLTPQARTRLGTTGSRDAKPTQSQSGGRFDRFKQPGS